MQYKTKRWVVIALLLTVAGAAFIAISQSLQTDALSGYERRWNLSLPFQVGEQFSASDPGFTGDGDRYTIFRAVAIPDSYFSEYEQQKDLTAETYVNKVAEELKIEGKNRPDFAKPYRWRRYKKEHGKGIVDTLLILYSDGKFYFIEEII